MILKRVHFLIEVLRYLNSNTKNFSMSISIFKILWCIYCTNETFNSSNISHLNNIFIRALFHSTFYSSKRDVCVTSRTSTFHTASVELNRTHMQPLIVKFKRIRAAQNERNKLIGSHIDTYIHTYTICNWKVKSNKARTINTPLTTFVSKWTHKAGSISLGIQKNYNTLE